MKNFYIQLNQYTLNHQHLFILINKLDDLTYIVFTEYTLYCFYMFYKYTFKMFIDSTIYKPLIALIVLSLLRITINRERPFQHYHYTPIIEHSLNKSMPSRHAGSAMIISLVFLSINPVLGIINLVLTLLIGISRVLIGVHYISDVCIGYLISLGIYLI